jgi:FAD-dependent urate hydroxylase
MKLLTLFIPCFFSFCFSHAEMPMSTLKEEVLDVAIIGGSMSGLSIAFALKEKGISNVQIFDCAEEGKESHWLFTARMKTLRSGKNFIGPALGHTNLNLHAWYVSKYGEQAWDELIKIPTPLWAEYLYWLRKNLDLQIVNGMFLKTILPRSDKSLELVFEGDKKIRARKVVLATGRGGYGGLEIPSFIQHLPKEHWAHTGEVIDPEIFKEKRICVIGSGASAFDAAAVALEEHAQQVHMLMRRKEVSYPNPAYLGFGKDYYLLGDDRSGLFEKAWQIGFRPPPEAFERVQDFSNFQLLPETFVEDISLLDNEISITTNQNLISADFLILATGYAVDGSKQPELATFCDKIALWGEKASHLPPKLGRFPYLGPSFEFLEKEPGAAPYLKNIHCFNFGAFLSHGRISGDIDMIHFGVERLAEGVVRDLRDDSP